MKKAIEQPTQEIVIREPQSDDMTTLMRQAEVLMQSKVLPPALDNVPKIIAVIMRGRELDIPPMEALTSINIIQGKVSASTQLMLALIYKSGLLEDIEMTRADPAICVMKRRGMTPHKVKFGSNDAKLMGLLGKDTYRKFPEVMFLWRAIAMCARVVFPDVIGAVYTPDELGVEIQSDVENNDLPVFSKSVAKKERALDLAQQGRTKLEITKVLSQEFGEVVTVGQVSGWLNG